MLNATKASLIHTLFFCMGQGKSTYTQSSINRFLELLLEYYNIDIKRSWIFQCLRDIEDLGLIRRQRRYAQAEDGLIRGIPSLWSFTLKGLLWLSTRGVTRATELYKKMIIWLQKQDGRWPHIKDFEPSPDDKIDAEAVERLKQLAEGVTKDIK